MNKAESISITVAEVGTVKILMLKLMSTKLCGINYGNKLCSQYFLTT